MMVPKPSLEKMRSIGKAVRAAAFVFEWFCKLIDGVCSVFYTDALWRDCANNRASLKNVSSTLL